MLKGLMNKFVKGLGFITIATVLASGVEAANFALLPAAGTFSSNFTVGVYVKSPTESVNAYSGTISFPADKLRVVSISRTGSIVGLWTQEPTFSNANGTINFEGITFNPGFQGTAGKIIDITFGVQSTGTAPVVFTRAQILANDGNGTDVTRPAENAVYNIVVVPPTPPAPSGPIPPTPPGSPTVKPETPTIIEYSNSVTQPDQVMISGKTDPSTKIIIFVQKDGEFKPGGSCEILASGITLKEGDEGENVTLLQMFLSNQFSIPKDTIVTGHFGPKTKAAVINFQNKYAGTIVSDIKTEDASGVVGSSTISKINKLSCGFLKELSPIDISLADGAYVLRAASEGLAPGKYHFWLKASTDKGVLSNASEAMPLVINGKPFLAHGDEGNGFGVLDILFIIALIAILVLPIIASPKIFSMKIGIYAGLLFIFGMVLDVALIRLSFWPRLILSVAVLSGIAYVWRVLREQVSMTGFRSNPSRIPKDPHAPPPYEP